MGYNQHTKIYNMEEWNKKLRKVVMEFRRGKVETKYSGKIMSEFKITVVPSEMCWISISECLGEDNLHEHNKINKRKEILTNRTFQENIHALWLMNRVPKDELWGNLISLVPV